MVVFCFVTLILAEQLLLVQLLTILVLAAVVGCFNGCCIDGLCSIWLLHTIKLHFQVIFCAVISDFILYNFPGEHTIMVLFADEEVPDSPIRVDVKAAHDSSLVKADGPGLEREGIMKMIEYLTFLSIETMF